MERTLYYVAKNLDYRGAFVSKGDVRFLDLPAETVSILVDAAAISPFGTPPFEMLPGWRFRAKRLVKNGVTVQSFLFAADSDLAAILGLPAELMARWRRELKEILGIDPDVSPGGKSG